jgi:hypothetical protein
MRQRRRRGLSRLARKADDGALGHRRPVGIEGTDAEKSLAFRKALKELESRIKLFTSLPIDSLDGMTLQAKLRAIGKSDPAPGPV